MSQIEIFQYPPGSREQAPPMWNGYGDAQGETHAETGATAERARQLDWEKRLAEETRKAFESGRERGREELRQAEQEAMANARRQEERRMAGVMESFTAARERYLHEVEAEVVKLALAVAARILRREAQMDPLLLTGAVRVALGQLSATTAVKLRVPACDLELWREAMAVLPKLQVKPEVLSGEGLRLGDCVVECNLGTVDLGVRSQLGEIERGFFDRAGGETPSAAVKEHSTLTETHE